MNMPRLLALVGVVIALAVVGFLVLKPETPGTTEIAVASEPETSTETDAPEVDTSSIVEMTMGDPDAPVTLIEYASYTCPHCAAFSQGPMKEIKKNYIDTGTVHLIYREVYFDKYGLWASMIARCAGPEKFFGITDLIYKGQNDWSRAGGAPEIVNELKKIGRLAGIEDDALEACLQDSARAETLIAWYQKHAKADEVTSTPSFLLNGKKVPNQTYAEFAKAIDAELAN